MFQHQHGSVRPQQRHSRGGDVAWLAALIETFEATGQSDLRAVPCEPATIAALKVQLARPPLPFSNGPQGRLLN